MDELIVCNLRIGRGAALYHAGTASRHLYFIRLGSFKTLYCCEQGHQLVTGFAMSNQALGLEAITGECHACSALALEDSEVMSISYSGLERLAQDMPALQANLNRLLSREIRRSQHMLITWGHYSAQERLAIFVLGLSRRFAARGYSAHHFVLRMSREDIASFIGVRSETICRSITQLRELQLVNIEGRNVEIIHLAQLEAFCQRGY
ncbi:helix-turn-helix domain-containing protein [Pseudomonas sp. LD120]|uniref:helix-turn-helix domain-containing protein n=1 Tax=Pseudomonas sp. LD120 TaxID=485751 RepID=UPI00211550AC|nr:helix-turn-helix domain-containing protein [Pseudomonas sp. LD120]